MGYPSTPTRLGYTPFLPPHPIQGHLGYPEEIMEKIDIAEPVPPLPRPAVRGANVLS